MALSRAELVMVTRDVRLVVATVLATAPKVGALREAASKLGSFDAGVFDRLVPHALMLAGAQAAYEAKTCDEVEIDALCARGAVLFEALREAAGAVEAGRPRGRAKALRSARRRHDLALKLIGLVGALRAGGHAEAAAASRRVNAALVDEAETVGKALVAAIARTAESEAEVAALAERRQRVFTLVVRSYDQVRRAVAFLRWSEGDAERLAPSLFGPATRRRKAKSSAEEQGVGEVAVPTEPVEPTVPPVG